MIIIGGGIIGLATGYQLLRHTPFLKLLILEKESDIGLHQTGHNSGVIHSGIYYKPGSLKAQNCRRGIELLLSFCNENNISYDICSKVIVATTQDQLSTLDILYDRGQKNGIQNLKIISSAEIIEYESHAAGMGAIYCPETGIIDYLNVCQKLSEIIQETGELATNSVVFNIEESPDGITVITESQEYKTHFLINCAGLSSDQVAILAGVKRDVRIVPFRGEYYMLKEKSKHLVKNLIYPVPDSRYPFLGVHFTRTIQGEIEAGPNAVLAWAREGYKKSDVNLKEMCDYLSYGGFWRMAGKYWTTALGEYYRSFFKSAFANSFYFKVSLENISIFFFGFFSFN